MAQICWGFLEPCLYGWSSFFPLIFCTEGGSWMVSLGLTCALLGRCAALKAKGWQLWPLSCRYHSFLQR